MAEDFFCPFDEDIPAAAPVFEESAGTFCGGSFVIVDGFGWM